MLFELISHIIKHIRNCDGCIMKNFNQTLLCLWQKTLNKRKIYSFKQTGKQTKKKDYGSFQAQLI